MFPNHMGRKGEGMVPQRKTEMLWLEEEWMLDRPNQQNPGQHSTLQSRAQRTVFCPGHFRSWAPMVWDTETREELEVAQDHRSLQDFPGVDKNPPASTEDLGSIPGLGRFHKPRSN